MFYITVFLAVALTARYAMLRILVWLRPNSFIELSYTDKNGKSSYKKVKVNNSSDAERLALLLREMKSNAATRTSK